jgi:CTP synthase (UTP-ammonia lyase)
VSSPARIGLVGDRSDAVPAHVAIPPALAAAGRRLERELEPVWLPTDAMPGNAELRALDGIWCVPASPYRDAEAALRAIRLARVEGIPFLGTCGGSQHALIEWARASGLADATHAEEHPDAPTQVIVPLACALVEVEGRVLLQPGSRAARLLNATETVETYHCTYGLSAAFAGRLLGGPMIATGWDEDGDVRVIELEGHPFFLATLFQPERHPDQPHGLVAGFVEAVLAGRAAR